MCHARRKCGNVARAKGGNSITRQRRELITLQRREYVPCAKGATCNSQGQAKRSPWVEPPTIVQALKARDNVATHQFLIGDCRAVAMYFALSALDYGGAQPPGPALRLPLAVTCRAVGARTTFWSCYPAPKGCASLASGCYMSRRWRYLRIPCRWRSCSTRAPFTLFSREHQSDPSPLDSQFGRKYSFPFRTNCLIR